MRLYTNPYRWDRLRKSSVLFSNSGVIKGRHVGRAYANRLNIQYADSDVAVPRHLTALVKIYVDCLTYEHGQHDQQN